MADEKMIREQMEDTRTALTEKLETLEQKVTDTVQEATAAVSDTVTSIKESVTDTVSTVKDSVQDTVTAVKDSVQGGVDTVKDWFDIPAHVDQHPWLAMGGSVLLGYCVGHVLNKKIGASSPTEPTDAGRSEHGNGSRMHHSTNGGARGKRRHEASTASSWLSGLGPEIAKLKGLAVGTLLGTLREMIVKSVPEHVGQQLKEVVDNVTTKLGGQPIPSSDLADVASKFTFSQGESHDSRDDAKMGGPVGSAYRQGEKNLGQFDRR
jgi:ElaB/YqjD/DUF883 family membrane-anchored ribosome-binding protein